MVSLNECRLVNKESLNDLGSGWLSCLQAVLGSAGKEGFQGNSVWDFTMPWSLGVGVLGVFVLVIQ